MLKFFEQIRVIVVECIFWLNGLIYRILRELFKVAGDFWIIFWGFTAYYGHLKSLLVLAYYRYLIMTVSYSTGPGPDQFWVNYLVGQLFFSQYTPFLVFCSLVVFLVPRQALRRDKLVRKLYRAGIVSTIEEAYAFVKGVSWILIVIAVLFAVGP